MQTIRVLGDEIFGLVRHLNGSQQNCLAARLRRMIREKYTLRFAV